MDRLDMIIPRIDALLQNQEHVLIAIDGSCTSGKTTLAAALQEKYLCGVFHMDDFFLRPEQRTDERFAEPGGNEIALHGTGGIHGGNRVGGNAVCDFIVFGRIAGQSASDFADAGGLEQAA